MYRTQEPQVTYQIRRGISKVGRSWGASGGRCCVWLSLLALRASIPQCDIFLVTSICRIGLVATRRLTDLEWIGLGLRWLLGRLTDRVWGVVWPSSTPDPYVLFLLF